jgi:hypothetical protein
MTALRNAIAEGDASGSMEGEEFFRGLDTYIGQIASEKGEKVA